LALAQFEFWMSPTWSRRSKENINKNEGNSALINPIEKTLPSIAAYQIFRGRAAQMSEPALQLLMVLRSKETQLNSFPSMELESAVRRILNREARLGWKLAMEQSVSELSLERQELANKIAVLDELDKEMRQLNQQLLQVDFDIQNIRPLRDWEDITRLSGQRVRRLREFIEIGAGLGLMKLRPVWLMNPDVASRILPLKAGFFDTVIYDEASQMPVEFSIPTLFRGKVTVVSGDEKQMPPSSFFTSKVESDEANVFDGELLDEDASTDERDAFEETWNRREIKDCPDLLQLARTNLPNTRLQIHYRSAYRELISFSNAAFYANDLSVPVHHPDDIIRQVQPIQMMNINGVYQDQTNRMEAEKVVDILVDIWKEPFAQRPSVGVVTFNRKQADLILDLIQDAAEQDPDFRAAYSQETERYEHGEDMRFFVRNVENVQGDERDVILFSSTFGRDSKNVFRKLFGVLGQKGGERRLNVAVTRARKKIYMVTSMPIADISNLLTTRGTPSTPRDFLQGYMEYARLVSSGEFDTARGLLSRIMPRREASKFAQERMSEDGFYFAVGDFLRSLGHEVEPSDDNDAFGLDYAIKHPDTGLFAIGIECDAPRHSLLEHARAREVWRPQVLRRSLNVLHRVSCYGWYHEPELEKARLLEAVKVALAYREVT
jgi:primosomal replication protein N''